MEIGPEQSSGPRGKVKLYFLYVWSNVRRTVRILLTTVKTIYSLCLYNCHPEIHQKAKHMQKIPPAIFSQYLQYYIEEKQLQHFS